MVEPIAPNTVFVKCDAWEPHGTGGYCTRARKTISRGVCLNACHLGVDFDKVFPSTKTPIKGLGDVVAKVTDALGIPKCGGCAKRQAALNKIVPL